LRQTLLVRIVATFVAVLALVPGALAGAAPSTPATVLGILYGDGKQTLTRLDAVSLAPLARPTIAIPSIVGRGLRSPDRSLLVLSANSAPVLTLVDVDRMQIAGTMRPTKAGTVELIGWPEQRRLFAYAWGCCPVRTDIIVVDPLQQSVVARVRLRGTAVSEGASAQGAVVLVAPAKGIGKARLVRVGPDGSSRTVSLTRIRAGAKWRRVDSQQVGSIRQPGLAVDPTGATAYVVDPSGLVAAVDLRTVAVTYRSSRTFSRAAKQLSGPMRHAEYVGDGLIAVSGTNAQFRKTRSGWTQTWSPAGVVLIDTRSWTSRVVDPQGSWFVPDAGALLIVAGGRLTAYELAGGVRYGLPVASGAFVERFGDYAYVWDEKSVTVLDARTGTALRTMPKPELWLVAADS
jgi:hypothetical protein